MMAELGHLREQAQADSAARRHAEEKLKQSQRDLCAAQMYINQLQQQNVKLSSRVRRLEKRMGHYDRGLMKINLGVAEIGLSPANPQRR
jgi:septal ring factor EnvC (AmiA/AmiB activator)